jgi:hypothetical protein
MLSEGGHACREYSEVSVGGLSKSVARIIAKHLMLHHPAGHSPKLLSDRPAAFTQYSKRERKKRYVCEDRPSLRLYFKTRTPFDPQASRLHQERPPLRTPAQRRTKSIPAVVLC